MRQVCKICRTSQNLLPRRLPHTSHGSPLIHLLFVFYYAHATLETHTRLQYYIDSKSCRVPKLRGSLPESRHMPGRSVPDKRQRQTNHLHETFQASHRHRFLIHEVEGAGVVIAISDLP